GYALETSNYTGASEDCAKLELEPLDVVVGFVVERPRDAELQRPERRVPGERDAGRVAPGLERERFFLAVDLPAVDERAQSHRSLLAHAGEREQQLRRCVGLLRAAERAAVDVARTERGGIVAAHAADAPEVEVLEERQRLSAVAAPGAGL